MTYQQFIEHLINNGYQLSVFDGEEWPLERSTNPAEVIADVESVDMAVVQIDRESFGPKTRVGSFAVIPGNGPDWLHDYWPADSVKVVNLMAIAMGEEL